MSARRQTGASRRVGTPLQSVSANARAPVSDPAEKPDHEHHAFIGAAKIIAACTMVSRVLGVVRDVLMAVCFGGGRVTSAFVTAWTIPNLFRRLFGEGAVSSALVPTFTESLKTRPNEETQRLFSVTFTAMFLFLTALTLLIEGIVNGLLWWGDLTGATRLLLEYTVILMPYMVLICLSAFFMAVLNSHRHFFAPAFMPVVLNVVWIAALYLINLADIPGEYGGRWLSLAILIGGGLQLLFQVPFALKHGVKLRPSLEFSHPGFRQILRLWVPVILGSAVIQINTMADRWFAYYLVVHDGSAAFLFFGNRLMHFPIALIGVAISTAVLTTLSEHAATGEPEKFKRALMSALRITLFLAIPASIGLVVLSSATVEMIYGHGKFAETPFAVVRTAWVLFCYAFGVWAHTAVFVLLRAFYALKDTRTPLKVATWMVLLNLALNLTLIWFLDEAGLALATSISGMAQFTVLFVILRRRLGPLGGRDVARLSLKTLIVSLVMGSCAALAWYYWWPTGAHIVTRAAVLVAIVLGAMAVFAAGTLALGIPELKQLLQLRRR